MKKFSERMGYVKVSTIIQKESMTEELRNSLWNVLYNFLWSKYNLKDSYLGRKNDFEKISNYLQQYHFKKPIDDLSEYYDMQHAYLKKSFLSSEWNEVYDFLEACYKIYPIVISDDSELFKSAINGVLKQELSAYRLIDGIFTLIIDKQEIEALEEALSDNQFKGVTVHLNTALIMLSDRKKPDYRNSIKESISAVESICKVIAEKKDASLGDALKALEKQEKINPRLKKGFEQLYAYTNNKDDGIRHALSDKSNVDADDAKYFLLSCTSFINYLKTKI